MAFLAAVPEVAVAAAPEAEAVGAEMLPEAESAGRAAFRATKSVFHEVEPVLRTLHVPIHQRPPPPQPPPPPVVPDVAAAAAVTGGGGDSQAPPWAVVTLALIVTLMILIVVLVTRRSRGCSGWHGHDRHKGGFCCGVVA